MINKNKFGKLIFKLRNEKGISQKELATLLNKSFQSISKWERGISIPDLDMILKICEVFNTSLGVFLFSVSSSMSLNKLVENVNENGIDEKNFMNLGALVQSDIFTLSVVKLFTDKLINKTLRDIFPKTYEYKKYSLLKAAHEICRNYASLIDTDFFDFEEHMINGISVLTSKLDLEYSQVVISKLIARMVEDNKSKAILLINSGKEKVHFFTRISNDLVEKGFNCFYITQLIGHLSVRKSIVGGGGGGGLRGHGGWHINLDDLDDNYLENSMTLFKQYVEFYNKDFKFKITK